MAKTKKHPIKLNLRDGENTGLKPWERKFLNLLALAKGDLEEAKNS